MNERNDNILWKDTSLSIRGRALKVGEKAPSFILSTTDLDDKTLENYTGQIIVLSIVPSIDTSTCSLQTKRFNEEATKLKGKLKILTASLDLPFALSRWKEAESCSDTELLSDYKHRSLIENYGLYIEELGLLARAVFVIDRDRTLRYVDYVKNLSDEPDYEAVLNCIANIAD